MSTMKCYRFIVLSSRIFHRYHVISNKNCFFTKTIQLSSSTSCYRSMCSKVPIDPDCKQPVFHPKKGELVYSGKITTHVYAAKALSLTTCTIGVAFQPYLYYNAESLTLPLMVALGGSLGFFMFITTGIIYFVTKKYITDIYYDRATKKFTASRYSFFLRRKGIEYTAEDVEVPGVTGVFTTMKIKGKPFFVDENCFKDFDVYMHMVGYDKPMEFKSSENENKNE